MPSNILSTSIVFFFFGYRVVEEQIKQIGSGGGERGVCILTFWCRNYIFNFSTPSKKM